MSDIKNINWVFNTNSSDNDKGHSMEETIKLIECIIRILKVVKTKNGSASIDTFKKYKICSYLYSTDKIRMMSTSLVDKEQWSYVFVLDTPIPRTWEDHFSWVKVLELVLCLKVRCVALFYTADKGIDLSINHNRIKSFS